MEDGFTPAPQAEPSSWLSRHTLTLLLIVINACVFAVEDARGGAGSIMTMVDCGARAGALIHEGDYGRLLTSLFLHMGPYHLLFNLVSLLIFGGIIEGLWGSRRFLLLYLTSGFAGNLLGFALSPSISVGASGAILGCAAALPACYAGNIKNISTRQLRFYLYLLIPYLVLNVYCTFLLPGIDVMAHMGGFLWGLLLSTWLALGDAYNEDSMKHVLPALVLRGFLAAAMIAFPFLIVYRLIVPEKDIVIKSYLNLARVYFDARRFDKASTWYEKVLVMEIENSEAVKMLGSSYAQQGEIKKTIALWEKYLKGNPDSKLIKKSLSDIYTLLAESGQSSGSSRDILQLYEKSIALFPGNARALTGAAICHRDRGDYMEAAAYLKKAMELEPENGEINKNYRLIVMTIFRVKWFSGLPLLPPPPKDPKNRAAILHREGTRILTKSGDYTEALGYFKKAIEANPRCAPAFLSSGEVSLVLGENARAREYFQKALKLNPRYADPYIGMGDLALEEKDKKAAFDYYQKAIALKRNASSAWSGLAVLRLKEGKKKDACRLALKARELDPRNPHHAILLAEIGKDMSNERQYFREMTTALALARNQKDVEDYVLKKLRYNGGE